MVQAKQLASNAIITITFATNISYQNLFMFLPKVKKIADLSLDGAGISRLPICGKGERGVNSRPLLVDFRPEFFTGGEGRSNLNF